MALPAPVLAAMHSHLHQVAAATIDAVTLEVPGYRGLEEREQANLATAVELALRGFLSLAADEQDPSAPLAPALQGAYGLGRGEARGGRTMDALLAAYRVGARVAWRGLAGKAAEAGLPADGLVGFAELVFAYIDQLSAASVAGHADELATEGRVRQRHLERLGHSLITGAPAESLVAAAQRARWEPPGALAAVILPDRALDKALARLDPRTLQPAEDAPGLATADGVLLVPVEPPTGRARILQALKRVPGVVGPTREWTLVSASYYRALRARTELRVGDGPIDTEEHLPELVIGADAEALADLRARALAPLQDLRPATAKRLEETLRSWLLHQGRREDVAADLYVHPQTVRYRMGQLRELFGDALEDPRTVLELTLALGP
ncbi:MAG: helix-turn-helix domain-containing protein [Candidatus Nanopelagicales bacterium]